MKVISTAAAAAILATLPACAPALELFVDCNHGSDMATGRVISTPLRTLNAAQRILRDLRRAGGTSVERRTKGTGAESAIVHVAGLCELQSTLVLDSPLDDNVVYQGSRGAVLSGGTLIDRVRQGQEVAAETESIVTVNLKDFNLTQSSLGNLSARGYS